MMLISRNYRRLWIGQAVSLLGDFAFDVTLMLWIATILLRGERFGPAVSSGVLMIVALVTVTVGPIAGVYVDRWDKRRTMLGADLIRAALVTLLTVIACLPQGVVPVSVIIVLIGVTVALTTTVSQFFGPARFVLIGDIVPSEHQGKAAGYAQAAFALAAIIGPPVAAPLVVGVGVQWALAFNALSFMLSYWAISRVRVERAAQPWAPHEKSEVNRSALRDFRAGLRSIRQNRLVVALLTSCMLATLGTGAVSALEVYFVQENLHANAGWFGLLAAAYGAGTLVGAFSGGILGDRIGHGAVFKSSLLAFGLGMIVYSRLESVAAAMVLSAVLGLALGALNTVVYPLILSAVPRAYLGRTMAVFNPANQSASILSIIAAGVAVSTVLDGLDTTFLGLHFGRIDTVFTISGVLALAGAGYAFTHLSTGVKTDIEEGADVDLACQPRPDRSVHNLL